MVNKCLYEMVLLCFCFHPPESIPPERDNTFFCQFCVVLVIFQRLKRSSEKYHCHSGKIAPFNNPVTIKQQRIHVLVQDKKSFCFIIFIKNNDKNKLKILVTRIMVHIARHDYRNIMQIHVSHGSPRAIKSSILIPSSSLNIYQQKHISKKHIFPHFFQVTCVLK